MSKHPNVSRQSRREFLKTAGIVSAGITATTVLPVARSANVTGSDVIKVALIGTGGRGLGCLRDRFAVGDAVKVVAIADVTKSTVDKAAEALAKMDDSKDMIDLSPDRVFSGFNGYKQAMEFADLVLIASPPAFHPDHYLYAVENGKHVFMEKPFGIDAEGYRRCMKANKIAEEKGLTVCSGFQRRHENSYLQWMDRIHNGQIGDILSTRVYWNCAGAKVRGVREDGESEMSFQVRDWYFFNWLSGDHNIEQHCHNIDIGNWIHGKGDPFAHPVSCVGMGGRQVRRTPKFAYNECGNIYDHHYVEYQYADGTVMHSQCRQIPNCWNSITEKVTGTKGHGEACWLKPNDGPQWKYAKNSEDKSAYQQEHFDQANAMRKGEKLHDGWFAATSSMIGVMGWMATYSGKEITWNAAIARGKKLFPYDVELSYDIAPPVVPGPDGTYEHAVPVPGEYDPYEKS